MRACHMFQPAKEQSKLSSLADILLYSVVFYQIYFIFYHIIYTIFILQYLTLHTPTLSSWCSSPLPSRSTASFQSASCVLIHGCCGSSQTVQPKRRTERVRP